MNQTLSTLAYDCWSVCICSTNDYLWLTMEMRFHSSIFNKGWKIPEHLLVFVLEHPYFLADPSATDSPSPTYPPPWLLWRHLTDCARAFPEPVYWGWGHINLRGDASYLSHNSNSPSPHSHTPVLGGWLLWFWIFCRGWLSPVTQRL